MPYQAVIESAYTVQERLAPLREALEARLRRVSLADDEAEQRLRVAASVEYI